MSKKPITVKEAYDIVLGNVLAISPEYYKQAMERIAKLTGRNNDEILCHEIMAISSQDRLCDLD